MRTIKQSLYLLALLLCFACTGCTKYDFVETGKAQSHLDKTMWEYFQTDDYNWSGLVLLIKRAGLEDLFQGKDTQYGPKFTFLGITNHSLRRYLYKTYGKKAELPEGTESTEGTESPEGSEAPVTPAPPAGVANAIKPSELSEEETMQLIERMDVETARKIILDCVIPHEALLLEDFPAGRKSASGEAIGTGGKLYTMASGKQLWLYTFRDAYATVPEVGANRLHIVSPETKVTRDIASHDIQTRTGVVHSLQYDFTAAEF
ncbi:fasciclin [Porphyromonas sp.]